MAAVDAALYEAKRSGKDRIVGYTTRTERVATRMGAAGREPVVRDPVARESAAAEPGRESGYAPRTESTSPPSGRTTDADRRASPPSRTPSPIVTPGASHAPWETGTQPVSQPAPSPVPQPVPQGGPPNPPPGTTEPPVPRRFVALKVQSDTDESAATTAQAGTTDHR